MQVKNQNKSASDAELERFFGTLTKLGKTKGYFIAWDFTRTGYSLIARYLQDNHIEIIPMTCEQALEGLIISEQDANKYDNIFKQIAPAEWIEPKNDELKQSA